MRKEECQYFSKEQPAKLRSMETYESLCEISKEQSKLELSKGVKRYCVLNDLHFFNIFENYSVDLMHDMNEGVIPKLLFHLFDHFVKKNICSRRDIEQKIQFFEYGRLSGSYIPTKVDITKPNLGLSAMQLYCLMINLPFILISVKSKSTKVWDSVESVLKIMEIVYSEKITESDLTSVEQYIDCHLKSIQKNFGIDLSPKHHFLLHYPRVIRHMGPVLKMWTMKLEAKHKVFTDIARNTNNFININKTMATKHQQLLLTNEFSYSDEIQEGKIRTPLNNSEHFLHFFNTSTDHIFTESIVKESFLLKFLIINGIEYRKDVLVKDNGAFYEIDSILCSLEKYWIISTKSYECKSLDKYSNSLILENKEDGFYMLEINKIELKKTFEKIFCNEITYVACKTLDVKTEITFND